jgi:hypothetical protein
MSCDWEFKFAITDNDELMQVVKQNKENKGSIHDLVTRVVGRDALRGYGYGLCPWGSCQYSYSNAIFDILNMVGSFAKKYTGEYAGENIDVYEFVVNTAGLTHKFDLKVKDVDPFIAAKLAVINNEDFETTCEFIESGEEVKKHFDKLFNAQTFEELFRFRRESSSHLFSTTRLIFESIFTGDFDHVAYGEMLWVLYAKGYVKDPTCFANFDT